MKPWSNMGECINILGNQHDCWEDKFLRNMFQNLP